MLTANEVGHAAHEEPLGLGRRDRLRRPLAPPRRVIEGQRPGAPVWGVERPCWLRRLCRGIRSPRSTAAAAAAPATPSRSGLVQGR